MKPTNFKNTSKILRTPKDKDNPYTMLSAVLLKLDGYERAIMYELLSNSDDFIINKTVIQKRLGFPHKKFNDAWRSLEDKHHILCDRKWGSVHWVIVENPYSKNTDIGYTDVNNGEKEAESETDRNTYTDITYTDITNTDELLTNNKKTNIKRTILRPRDLKAKETIKTDSIFSPPGGEKSQSDTGDTPVDIEPLVINKDIFQYSITSGKDLDLELPQLDIELQEFDNDFDN